MAEGQLFSAEPPVLCIAKQNSRPPAILRFAPAVPQAARFCPALPAAGRRHEGRERRRSEEHTSELQSLMRISYAVFCLKKKKHTKIHIATMKNNLRLPNHTI